MNHLSVNLRGRSPPRKFSFQEGHLFKKEKKKEKRKKKKEKRKKKKEERGSQLQKIFSEDVCFKSTFLLIEKVFLNLTFFISLYFFQWNKKGNILPFDCRRILFHVGL